MPRGAGSTAAAAGARSRSGAFCSRAKGATFARCHCGNSPRSHMAWSAFYESEGVRSLPRWAKSPAWFNPEILRSEARAGSVNPGAGSRRSLGLRLEVPARRSPVYTIAMSPIIPTPQMLSIAPTLLTTQRLILRPRRESIGKRSRLNGTRLSWSSFHGACRVTKVMRWQGWIQAAIEERGWGFWVASANRRVRRPIEQALNWCDEANRNVVRSGGRFRPS
jgi:hypothetical protein